MLDSSLSNLCQYEMYSEVDLYEESKLDSILSGIILPVNTLDGNQMGDENETAEREDQYND